jgi:hypothetical protein
MNFLFESRLCYNIQNLPKKGDHLGSNLKIKNEKKPSFKYLFMRISYITSFIISVFLILSLHCLYFNWVLIIHIWYHQSFKGPLVAQWVRSLDLTAHTSLSPIRRGFAPNFVDYKKGALDSQPQVIKFTSCLARVGGSQRIHRLPPPIKLVTMT